MVKKIFAVLGSIIVCVSTIILVYYLVNLSDIETHLRYLGIFLISSIVFLIICLTLIYARKRTKLGLIGFYLLIIIIISLSFGINFLNYNFRILNKTIGQITSNLETVSVSLVSLKKNEDILNIKNEKIAISSKELSKNINKLSLDIIDDLKYDNESVIYEDFYKIADDLISGDINYAILPTNYLEIYAIYDEYADFSQKLIVNLSKEKIQEIEQEEVVVKDINDPFTILIIGVDTLSSSYNADTLLVVTFNPKTLTSTMLSIPRDTYTTLANGAKHKINASGWSGDRSVVKTVSNYLDIKIDYYLKINFTGAVSLVNAVGGIDVQVPYSFCEQNSKRKWGNNTIFVEKGLQHLDGEQALALSRNRHSPSNSFNMKKYCPTLNDGVRNDFIRGKNQQLVLKAMINSLKDIKDLETFYSILDALGKNMSTNMSRDTILSFYNLGKTIIANTEGVELSNSIKIQKLFFTSYFQAIRLGNMELSTVGHYGGSLDVIKTAMKENLGLADKKTIKTISFDANNKYVEKVIGQGIYTNQNKPKLVPDFVKKNLSAVETWAKANGYTLQIEEREITNNSYTNNTIISQNPKRYIDLTTIRNKMMKVVVAKVKNTNTSFDYKQCLIVESKDDSRCILEDYTNSSLSSFKSWINKTGISINVIYIEMEGKDDNITYQSIKGKSLYDIINNNLSIEIRHNFIKKED